MQGCCFGDVVHADVRQVLPKLSDRAHDKEVTLAIAKLIDEGQGERHNAFQWLKAVDHAMQVGCGLRLRDFVLPGGPVVRPLTPGETRLRHPGTHDWTVYRHGGQTSVPELPHGMRFRLLNIFAGQCSIGVSDMGLYMYHVRGLAASWADVFHRSWNDTKNAAKSGKRCMMKAILELTVAFNLDFSPFATSDYFHKKLAALNHMMLGETEAAEWFQVGLGSICRDRSLQVPSSQLGQTELWKSLPLSPTFAKKGTRVKTPEMVFIVRGGPRA